MTDSVTPDPKICECAARYGRPYHSADCPAKPKTVEYLQKEVERLRAEIDKYDSAIAHRDLEIERLLRKEQPSAFEQSSPRTYVDSLTSNEVIHFYAGWCGKVLCAAGGNPISSIKADDVTCEACKTMLMPARLLQPCVVDGDELAKIEDGWGDPAGTYLKYRGQVWINDGWLDNSKVRALRDWLNSTLSDECTSAVETPDEATAAHWLGELLAVIHRDGGQYEAKHGSILAAQDAIKLVYFLRGDRNCKVCDGLGYSVGVSKRNPCDACDGTGLALLTGHVKPESSEKATVCDCRCHTSSGTSTSACIYCGHFPHECSEQNGPANSGKP